MAVSISATGLSSSSNGGWGCSMVGEDCSALAKSVRVVHGVRVGKGVRAQPMMKNVNEGKGVFAPVVVEVARNLIGKKRFNQLRGKAIALHSQMRDADGDGEGSPRYTVDEALIAIGFGKFQILVLAYAGLAWFSEAMEVMILSFIGPAVQSLWDLSSHEESLITSVVFVGMLIGAYSWGLVSDKHGRRKGFFITAMITSAAGFLSAFAPNYASLIILRCLVGLGVGGGPVLSSWFLEFIPAPERGTWMVVFSAFWTLGTIFEASLAWMIMPDLGWRWLLALSAIPSSLLLVFYKFTPESPRYLCLNNRTTDAVNILEKIARTNGAKLPPGILVSGPTIEQGEKNFPADDTQLLSPGKTKDSAHRGMTLNVISSLSMLLSPKLLRSTLLLWVVFFGNAFSYYGLVLLTSVLSNGSGKCENGELLSKDSQGVNYGNVFIASFAEFPGLLLSAAMVDKLGRKFSMSSMFFACSIFLLPLISHQPQGLTTALLFGARICITSAFTVVYIYAPEVYPTSVRTTGVGIASSMGRIGGMACPLIAVGLVNGCHQTAAILLFEIVVLISGVCVLFFPLETNNRELSDEIPNKSDQML